MGANISSPFPAADILDRATVEPISEDRVALRMPGTIKDNTQYQRTSDGWKYVVLESTVDAYIRRVRER